MTTPEERLRERLRKIEALFAGAATAGERIAAGAAASRIRERLDQVSRTESDIEVRFSIHNSWSRQLFVALCRRYGLRPYRYPRMHRQSIMIRAPESFIDEVLWPEYEELDTALDNYLDEITQKVIREEVHGKTGEADEVAEPPSHLGGGRYAPKSESTAGGKYPPHSERMAREHQAKGTSNTPKPEGRFEAGRKVGRNSPCPCGSGRKFKKCCLNSPMPG